MLKERGLYKHTLLTKKMQLNKLYSLRDYFYKDNTIEN